MKSIKLSSRISKETKSKTKDIHNLEEGITKALLEKYKPKVLCNIETSNGKDHQKRAA